MIRTSYIVHALSPLHAGTGQGVGIVDLPIARMKATGIPMVPGSSIKGVLRDRARNDAACDDETWKAVFGPDSKGASEHAGAIVVGDARLLALPVRALRGVFAWVTSPLLLSLAARDFREDATPPPGSVSVENRKALTAGASDVALKSHVVLEDLDLRSSTSAEVSAWAEYIAVRVFPDGADSGEQRSFTRRFVVVDDDTMAYLWETATQVDARNSIDHKTGTVKDGALWYEESLPPETLLVGQAAAERSRRNGSSLDEESVLDAGMPTDKLVLQLGGKATVGRGVCRVLRAQKGGGAS